MIKYILSPVGQPRAKGEVLFLEILMFSQIGLSSESIYIYDLQDKG